MRGNETIEECAYREITEETGITPTALMNIGVFSEPYRDPRGRVISNAFLSITGDENLNPKGSTDAVEAAKRLARESGAVVVISGETDYITDGSVVHTVEGGDPIMTSVTGMGCTATALTGAFAAVCKDPMTAAVAAMAVMSAAGEKAAAQANGNGSMQMHFLDELYNLTEL
jgi:hydroxyethylthiazole kinase-like sugar kinase family protein